MVQFKQAPQCLLQNSCFSFSFVGTVLLCVHFQTARCCAGVVALFASERFLTSVREHVNLKMICSCALVAALLTAVGLFSAVGEHVLL